VTTKETIKYKRSIRAFDKVSLVTKIVHWNERRFYMEQAFFVKGEQRAVAYVEGLVKGPKGHIKPNEAFKALGINRAAPPLPENLKVWVDLVYEI